MQKKNSRFEIRSVFNSRQHRSDLTEAEFDELKRARKFLLDCMEFEESVHQFLFAIQEYEEFILKAGLRHYLFPRTEYNAIQDARMMANLRVLGCLNSVSSLKDQFPIFSTLKDPKAPKRKFEQCWNYYKSQSIALRFCERVRNYAQHQTQPVRSVTMGSGWDDDYDLMETSISVFLDTKDVCRHRNIKKVEAEEYLASYGERADISLVLRESAAVLGQIVKEVREFLSADFALNADAYDKFLEIGFISDSGRQVSIATRHRGAELVEEIQVFEEFVRRVRRLHSTLVMTNNHKHFVSNKIRSKKKN